MILILNCGSSSIKFGLFSNNRLEKLVYGSIEEISSKNPHASINSKRNNFGYQLKKQDHNTCLKWLLEKLQELDFIEHKNDIIAIGHRVVHGGKLFSKPTKINTSTLKQIKQCFPLAPLHNPYNYHGIEICTKIFNGIPQVAVFDTSYHNTIPNHAKKYAISNKLAEKHNIQKYGFHGISHQFIVNETSKLLKNDNLRIISCHLGNGASICASKNKVSIDTSMGFSTLEGLPMGTRPGNLDPGILLYLLENKVMSLDELKNTLYKNSGLYALSQVSSDMRDIEPQYLENKNCKTAIDVFVYQTAKVIGSYITILNGADAIVFTGGIGENSAFIRKLITDYFEYLNIKIDQHKNISHKTCISTAKSNTKVLIIHTEEEYLIAKETKDLLF